MNKQEIEKFFYIDKEYSKIKELLKNSNESWSFNMLGKIYLTEGDFNKAYLYFNKAGNAAECGYCKFLRGEVEESVIILTLIKDSSPFVNWILFLSSLITQKYSDKQPQKIYPTYFQIRNFYEQDLEMLFISKQYKMIEKIISQNSYLEKFNREIYKYSARVLFNNGYVKPAKKLLEKSIDICYNDPETHYIMGEIYIKEEQNSRAIEEFKKADKINNGYLPALNRLKDLCN